MKVRVARSAENCLFK